MSRAALRALVLLPIGGCAGPCDETTIFEIDAPDARRRAVLFQRDCGVASGFSTQIAVVTPGRPASERETVFRADDDHGAAATGAWRGPWAEMRWLAGDHLLVRYDERARVFERADQGAGVRVTYRTVGR